VVTTLTGASALAGGGEAAAVEAMPSVQPRRHPKRLA
jgi:hypothetical protein